MKLFSLAFEPSNGLVKLLLLPSVSLFEFVGRVWGGLFRGTAALIFEAFTYSTFLSASAILSVWFCTEEM